jgi:hypothetical protein
MIRAKHARVVGLPETSDAGLTETAKETTANWLRQTPSSPGVLLRGLRYPDQTIVCDADSRDLTAAALEEAFRSVHDVFVWLKGSRIVSSQVSWHGERGELHCVCRPDRIILGALTSAKTTETDLSRLAGQLTEFQNLEPVTAADASP